MLSTARNGKRAWTTKSQKWEADMTCGCQGTKKVGGANASTGKGSNPETLFGKKKLTVTKKTTKKATRITFSKK
jgi:hypothetical protein